MTHPATTVYTIPNCQPCKATKRDLTRRGVTYTEVDMSQDETALNYVKELGHQKAPVVVVATSTQPVHWSGFQPALINEHFN